MKSVNRRVVLATAGWSAAMAASIGLARAQGNFAEGGGRSIKFVHALVQLGRISLETSLTAMERASDEDVRLFAAIEVAEQETMLEILSNSDAVTDNEAVLALDADAFRQRLAEAETGEQFDLTYVEGQIDLHNRLLEAGDVLADARELSLETTVARMAAVTMRSHVAMLQYIQQLMGRDRLEALDPSN